jgi:hypothetical protein
VPVVDFYFSGFFGIIIFPFSLALYFLPTIIAITRTHPNAVAIFVPDFFLGWTFVGWVVVPVRSVTRR